jgi:hypothetical protein
MFRMWEDGMSRDVLEAEYSGIGDVVWSEWIRATSCEKLLEEKLSDQVFSRKSVGEIG